MRTTHGAIEKTAGDVARAALDSVLVFLSVETAHHYRMGRHEVLIEPGDIGIVPMTERFQCATDGIAFKSMMVPSGLLGRLLAARAVTRAERLPAGSPLGGASLGRSVADVGWGFNSLSVLYRAFTAAFGASPGSVRHTAAAEQDPKSGRLAVGQREA